MKGQWKGFFFVVGAAFMWGLAGNVAKYFFNQQVNAVDVVQMRLFFSFIFLFLYLVSTNRSLIPVARADIPHILIFSVCGVTAVQFTYLLAISKTNVATAIFLQYLAPVLVLGYGLLRRQEKLTAVNGSAILFSVLGGFLMVKGNPGGGLAVSPAGLAAGLSSALAFALYTLLGKKWLATYSPWALLLYGFGTGSLLFTFYRLPWLTFFRYSWEEWLFFIYIALFSSILPFGMYFKGLQYLTPIKTNLTSTLEPVVAAVLAYLLLGEILTPWQVAGCAFILGGVILIQLAGQTTAKKAISAEHISAAGS
ncbi:EamA family transporter [Desulfofundulus thermobenzoicus]|uniref:EamA family transporter n=1 Tax=Desulfofundulus thermobenzoicus TaxID=29376 RepID=A0A6N7IV04_9FIRM|nr:DMT family transporter [Desulfofundulus thermobenzoicus]MQL52958.1 EamA family transporter [Desulfofundulus thermobenzoicus]